MPYEKRVQSAGEASDTQSAIEVEGHRVWLGVVEDLLAELGDRSTDCYLEILRPHRGIGRYLSAQTTITKPGLHGGPNFAIAEVLSAYRIPDALWAPPFKGERSGPFNAYVVPDGRVWRQAGEGETCNTYQLLESSGQHLGDLFVDDLERLAGGLGLILGFAKR